MTAKHIQKPSNSHFCLGNAIKPMYKPIKAKHMAKTGNLSIKHPPINAIPTAISPNFFPKTYTHISVAISANIGKIFSKII